MKTHLAMTIVLGGAMLAGGCATKKYVRNSTAPIQAKVDQVGDQTNKNTTSIDESRKEIKAVDERATTGISAAKERAMTADNHAGEAMKKAEQATTAASAAQTKADQDAVEIASLRNVVTNLDDYKPVAETSVQFGWNKDKLTDEGQAALDKLITDKGNVKRFVVAVEGFTDKTGSAEYNQGLSRRRAYTVVNYLVTKYDIPLYRIYVTGLGAEKLADEGRGKAANAKNRRVEVKIYSADQTVASNTTSAH
jgi:outer membrane protein OmpA-like peptidoglycan-associated protein